MHEFFTIFFFFFFFSVDCVKDKKSWIYLLEAGKTTFQAFPWFKKEDLPLVWHANAVLKCGLVCNSGYGPSFGSGLQGQLVLGTISHTTNSIHFNFILKCLLIFFFF